MRTVIGIVIIAAIAAVPIMGALILDIMFFAPDNRAIAEFAVVLTYAAGVYLLCDITKRSRQDWKEAVTTRDGRIILALGAVTLILTIAMMVGAHLQILG